MTAVGLQTMFHDNPIDKRLPMENIAGLICMLETALDEVSFSEGKPSSDLKAMTLMTLIFRVSFGWYRKSGDQRS